MTFAPAMIAPAIASLAVPASPTPDIGLGGLAAVLGVALVGVVLGGFAALWVGAGRQRKRSGGVSTPGTPRVRRLAAA